MPGPRYPALYQINTRVWLTELSCGLGRSATLDDIADAELDRLVTGARCAHEFGLRVNAGHGISIHNISRILDIPHLDTLNIGHSIVARSVFIGLEEAVKEMIGFMSAYDGART